MSELEEPNASQEQSTTNKGNSRELAQDLAAKDSNQSQFQEPNKEDKALGALNRVANFARRIGSKALNVVGFAGVTVGALSYILFGLKLLLLFLVTFNWCIFYC